METVNKKLKAILLLIGIVAFTIPTFATIYEDAEDNATTGWISYGDTTGATIENVFDIGRGSLVIKLTGNGKRTGYSLGNRSGRASYIGAWHNQTEKMLKWSMKYNEPFRIYIPITTEQGNRYLTYTNQSVDKKGKIRGGKVSYGLGEDSVDGTWHTFTRDLEADWNAFMPDDPFVAVNGFFIRGSGYIDDVMSLDDENPSVDTTKPVIRLLGNTPVTLNVGDTYTDAGATATDNVDGNITSNIQVTGLPIDTSSEGNYTVTYSVSDSSGNIADVVTRTVRVTNVTTTVATTLIKKTGQTISYYPNDDGDYQKGVTPSYTRDDATQIVTDNITKLQWQDDEEAKTVQRNWQGAKDYCSNLNLGSYSDWRLPSVVELQSIVIDGEYYPNIDTTVFANYINSNYYWSRTTFASRTNHVWVVFFYGGYTGQNYILLNRHVRCVRAG